MNVGISMSERSCDARSGAGGVRGARGVSPVRAPPPGTRAGDLPNLRARITDAKLAGVERLKPWAEARGHTTAELAIAWLLSYPEVSSVIVGARSAAQVEANVRAGDWSLSPSERDEALALAQAV
jgi:aryl-alcohol dehydrogenase-like predicted oxidoreductase